MTFYHRNYEWHNPDNRNCGYSTSIGVASPDADWCSCPEPEERQKKELCISCMKPIFKGQEWCQTPQCDTDLRDSNNRIPAVYIEPEWEGLVWGTYDGRVIPVDQMDRHHTWNTIRMLERKGAGSDLITKAMRKHLGEVSKREEAFFHLKNIVYRITHPWFRRH